MKNFGPKPAPYQLNQLNLVDELKNRYKLHMK